MGEAWLQRHESYFLEDKVGKGRVLECHERVGLIYGKEESRFWVECTTDHGNESILVGERKRIDFLCLNRHRLDMKSSV